ncbi:gag-pol, partial [Mucuna pruriens]
MTSQTSNYCTWIHLPHGSQTYAISLWHHNSHQRHPDCIKRRSRVMPSTIYGMTCIIGSVVATKSFAAAGGGHHGSTRAARKGIDFMGSFPISNGYSYILLAVDYMSRWVEAVATKTNDAKVVVNFLKFGVPKALISDQGSHFCNRAMSSLLEKYGVVHRVAIVYHPQTNDQAEVFNREIKKILQKLTNSSWKDWSCHLEEALWAHRTTYQTL